MRFLIKLLLVFCALGLRQPSWTCLRRKEACTYSKEERERVLSDFHASGLPLSRFSTLPGSPSRQAIRSWLKQEEAGLLDVPAREIRGRAERPKHQRYSEQTKREAVRLYSKGMRAADVARRLGVSSGTVVTGWARLAGSAPRCATMPSRRSMPMDAGEKAEMERLEEELERSRMRERVLLELMRDPKAGDPERLSNKQKTALGERLRRDFGYSQRQVVSFFGMPKSTYAYDLREISRDTARAERVAENARRAFEESGGTYGYRRVRAAMAAWEEPFEASEREEGMSPMRTRRRRRYSSYAGECDERPANLPLREDGTHDFSADAPDQMVVTDVTEFAVGGRKAYLSPVIDCFDGLPAAWSVSSHPDSALCDSSLEGYLASGAAAPGVVCHTDGGRLLPIRLLEAHLRRPRRRASMSRKGRSPDNVRAEGFFGTLKEELCNGRDWSRCSVEEFARRLDAYIGWYRDGRLKAFREGGKTVYDTIMGRRRRLGYAT